jgi:peptide deformylase
VLINPTVMIDHGRPEEATEGCLSLPGAQVKVTRSTSISLAWTNLDGSLTNADLSGLWARCALHELDHLNGITLLDRVEAEDRAKLVKALERRLRRGGQRAR